RDRGGRGRTRGGSLPAPMVFRTRRPRPPGRDVPNGRLGGDALRPRRRSARSAGKTSAGRRRGGARRSCLSRDHSRCDARRASRRGTLHREARLRRSRTGPGPSVLPAACRTASTGASSREHNGTGHERQSRQLRADERKRYARDVDANTAQRTSDSLRKAERCDAEGRHAEALNHLAAAARNSDVEALTRLGKRLLVGDRAPHLPNDGARLLQDAAALGGAEAAAVLSVLYAVGASKRHGLPEALESLVLAAERGWAPAQAQLRVLLADAGGADDYDGDGADLDWRRKAAEIDLSTWQTPRGGTDLNTSPRVCLLSGFLGDAVCSWLIEKARGRLTRARVYEALSKRVTVSETRTNTAATMNLLDTDLV